MIKIKIDAAIKSPIEEVFARITDLSGYSRWMSKSGSYGSTELTSEGPVGLATTYLDHTKFGTFRGEVIEYQKPVKVAFRQKLTWLKIPVMENWTWYNLESVGVGTFMHHRAEGKLFGLFAIAQPIVSGIVRHERERTINALKQTLET